MPRPLGEPRNDLIDLMTSTVGQMIARQIDASHGDACASPEARRLVSGAAARIAELIRTMNRDQLEACDPELNTFFRVVPFSEAIPVAVAVELKWPHHIETLPEARQKLNLIRKGGEYAMAFSEQKIESVFAHIANMEPGQ